MVIKDLLACISVLSRCWVSFYKVLPSDRTAFGSSSHSARANKMRWQWLPHQLDAFENLSMVADDTWWSVESICKPQARSWGHVSWCGQIVLHSAHVQQAFWWTVYGPVPLYKGHGLVKMFAALWSHFDVLCLYISICNAVFGSCIPFRYASNICSQWWIT